MGNDPFEIERKLLYEQIAALNRHNADLQHLLAMANAHITKFFYLMGFRTDPPPPAADDDEGKAGNGHEK